MGFPFVPSLHNLIEKIGQPIQALLPVSDPSVEEEQLLLWDCYLSGQMTEAALTREMAADPGLAAAFSRLEMTFRRPLQEFHLSRND